MDKRILVFLIIGIMCIGFASAHWWDPWHFFHEEDETNSTGYEIVSTQKAIFLKKFTGLEKYLIEDKSANIVGENLEIDLIINTTVYNWFKNTYQNWGGYNITQKIQKCQVVENNVKEDYPNFDCTNQTNRNQLGAKIQNFATLGMQIKKAGNGTYTNISNGTVQMSIPVSVLIDKEIIEIGEDSLEYEIQNQTSIFYRTDFNNMTISLQDDDIPLAVNDINITDNGDNLKFSGTNNNMSDDELRNHTYTIKSTSPLYKDGWTIYVKNPNRITTDISGYYETHEFDFNDVCSRGFNSWNETVEIEEENFTITHYNETAQCEFTSYEIEVDENNTDYYYEISFISDKYIDPEISIGASDWAVTSLLTNVTAESGDTNFTHLDIAGNSTAQVGFNLTRRTADAPYNFDDTNSFGEFDGDGDEINMGDVEDVEAIGEITVSAWVKTPQSLADGGTKVIIQKSDSFRLRWATSEDVDFLVFNESGSQGTGGFTDAIRFNENEWIHIVGVYNGANISVYRNAVLDTNDIDNLTGPIRNSTDDLMISSATTSSWNGSIDNVEIWNSSLSSSDISTLFADGRKSSTSRNSSTLVGQWRFDNTSESEAVDTSTGQLSNGTFTADAAYSYEPLGLQGYWNFDGDLVNTQGATSHEWNGNDIDGTMISNATVNSTNCLSNYGNCIQLDGVDEGSTGDSVNLGDNDIVEGINTFSVSAWVYPKDVSSLAGIVSKSESGQASFFLQQWSSNDLDFRVHNGTSSYNPTATFANAFLNNDQWYHVLGVYNGTHILVYVNGTVGGTIDELTGPTAISTSDTLIGAYRPDDRFYNGSIDEVMIFDTALTAEQVLDIYNNASARFKPTGTQKVRASKITNETNWDNNGFDRINLSTTIQENKDSSIEARVGQLNLSVNSSGLVYYAPFEWGTAVDISGEGNDGTIFNDTFFNETGGQNFSGGFEFDGDGDWINVADPDIIEGVASFSVSAWVQSDLTITSMGRGIVSQVKGGGGDNFNLFFATQDDWRFFVAATGSATAQSNDDLSDTGWHHLMGVYNGSNVLLYLDSVLQDSQPALTGNVLASTNPLTIGTHDIDRDFNGSIDTVMIFNRSLSATEISNLYNNQSAARNLPYFTAYQNITTDTNETFVINKEADFVFPDYLFRAGNTSTNPFYSPLIQGNINGFITAFNQEDVSETSLGLLKNVTAEQVDNNHTHLTINNLSAPYDSLRGYWNFDGDNVNSEGNTSYDWTSNNFDGVMTSNAVVNSSGCLSGYGNCAQFDSSTATTEIDMGTIDLVSGSNEMTVMAWVNMTEQEATTSGLNGIVAQDDGTPPVFLLSRNNGEDFRLRVYNDSGAVTAVDTAPITEANTWFHVVGVKNSSHIMIYINGVLNVTPVAMTDSIESSPSMFQIGGGNNGRFNGSIDEVMVFNISLSSQQILDIYNNQSARFKPQGTQKVRATNINQDGTFDRVNISTTIQENKDSRIELRAGQINESVNLSGLVLYTPFEWGSAFDISSKGNDGTLVGDIFFNETGGQNFSGGFEFDGDGDYIDLPDSNITEGKASITVSAWVKSNVADSGHRAIITDENNGPDVFILYRSEDEQFTFTVSNSSTSASAVSGTTTADIIWHHVVGIYNGSAVQVYVDGTAADSTPPSLIGNTNTGTLGIEIGIAAEQSGTFAFWNGSIDTVMIFNRSLSATEISNLYNNQSAARNLPYFTAYQNITSDVNETFNISTEADFVFPDYLFRAGNTSSNPFYSPIIQELANVTGFSSSVGPDTTPPTWSDNQTNSTIAGQSTNFSLQINDETALHPNGQYIFSTNNSDGNWTNDSAINFTTTPNNADVTKVLNSTVGTIVGYRWYLTDNAGNQNDTGIFTLTTTSAIDTSFTVTLPANTLEATYNASNSTHKNVSAINQTSSIPFFNVTNAGNVNLDFNVSLNASLPSGISLKGDTDNDPAGATSISTSSISIFTTLTPTTSFGIWYWTDFTNALEQTISRQLNLTTSQS